MARQEIDGIAVHGEQISTFDREHIIIAMIFQMEANEQLVTIIRVPFELPSDQPTQSLEVESRRQRSYNLGNALSSIQEI